MVGGGYHALVPSRSWDVTPGPLGRALDALRERASAERWVVCWHDGSEWRTFAPRALPRDQLYVAMATTLCSAPPLGSAWLHRASPEFGDLGVRLSVAGVRRLLVMRSGIAAERALAIIENPEYEAAAELATGAGLPQAGDLFSELEHALREGIARRVAGETWAVEFGAMHAWLPAINDLARGETTGPYALQALGALMEVSGVVLLASGTATRADVAYRRGDDWVNGTALLEGESLGAADIEPDRVMSLALARAVGIEVSSRWTTGQAKERGIILGVIPQGRQISPEALDLCASIIAGAIQHATSAVGGRQAALLQERSRIASVIHEGLTQVVTNVAIQLELLDFMLDDPARAKAQARASRTAVLQALDDLRGAIFELAPPSHDWADPTRGMEEFLRDYGAQWGLSVALEIRGVAKEISPDTVALAFAFVQEGLTNIRKHAGVDDATVLLDFAETLRVEVRDEGNGFDPTEAPEDGFRRHMGLSLMRERAWLLGGKAVVQSAPGEGTSFTLELPL